jgi:uncharacterized repeat protein (TIGR03803 family)
MHRTPVLFVAAAIASAMPTGCATLTTAPAALDASHLAAGTRESGSPPAYARLYSFQGGKDGRAPQAGLVASNGTLYGTTSADGLPGNDCYEGGCGTIFAFTPPATEHVLYRFKGSPDAASPFASLLLLNGSFYGTTESGGTDGCSPANSCGAVFTITKAAAESVVYAFEGGQSGGLPVAPLVEVAGTLYGTTQAGGEASCGCGTVFSLTPSGTENVLHQFAGKTDGATPEAGLLYADGAFYGTTVYGGNSGCPGLDSDTCGTVFKITGAGQYTQLYRFKNVQDAWGPQAPLIDVNGTLYGTSVSGGSGSCFSQGCGTVFAITSSGEERIVYSFKGGADGRYPYAGLTYVDGKLYGTTIEGGTGENGTLFSVTPSGKESVLYNFLGGSDGSAPTGTLLYENGRLYGVTGSGGVKGANCPYGCGTIFRWTL